MDLIPTDYGERGMRRRAFTLIEVLVGMLFLSLALLGLLTLNSSSNRGTMDAYYEFMALSLAQEPIEIFRGFGYHWLCDLEARRIAAPPEYPLEWSEIHDQTFSEVSYPSEACLFQRHIGLTPVEKGGVKAIRVKVRVGPRAQTRAMAWLSRTEVALEALILEGPR